MHEQFACRQALGKLFFLFSVQGFTFKSQCCLCFLQMKKKELWQKNKLFKNLPTGKFEETIIVSPVVFFKAALINNRQTKKHFIISKISYSKQNLTGSVNSHSSCSKVFLKTEKRNKYKFWTFCISQAWREFNAKI